MSVFDEVKWDDAENEATELFKDLIRFETVNPPGNEKPCAEYIADALSREGLDPEVIDTAPGRAATVARIKGTGEKPPILLNGHIDVVAVEQDKWSVPAFDAVERDGFIYGRGAVDMKNMVTMSMMCMALMKRAGVTPKRDLIFCAVPDEEAGGAHGSQYMVANHADKVTAEYSISEMGGFSMEMEGKRFYLVQVAEKGVAWLKVRTKGDPGHGSIPDPHSAVVKAARMASDLMEKGLPQHNVEAMAHFVGKMAAHLPFPKSMVFKMLMNPSVSKILLEKVFPDKGMAYAFKAMLHNTANPTVFRAGEKTNVIPSEAEFELDGRILPGFTTADFIEEVRAVIGEGPDIEVMHELTPTEAPAGDPIMSEIERTIEKHDPGAVVLPNLVTGFTDATHWKKLGMKCYGFSPLKMPAGTNFKELFHGHDEKIPVEGFRFGVRVLFDLVERMIT